MEDKLKVLNYELSEANLTIGTIEHCTSGLLGASISSIVGLGGIYKGTIVTVNSDAMGKLLDLSPNVFKNNDFVSSQTACQLALGGLYKLNVDLCVSIIGDVNPIIDSDNKVWICMASHNDKRVNFTYNMVEVNGSLGKNIEQVINEALDTIIGELKRMEVEG
jgi:nicotinamide-nucleotide amidase